MAGRPMKIWFKRISALLCLSLVWAPSAAVTDPNDARVMVKLQQTWGSVLTTWTGNDPCGDKWVGTLCDANTNQVIYMTLINLGLEGEIPPEIGSLPALSNLDLSFNDKLKGSIPSELGNLQNLKLLSLQQCSLTGFIPASLGQLVNLTYLALNGNKLTGPIPSALGALSKLKWFDVAYNRLSGSLPVSSNNAAKLGLDTWPVIQHYHLNNNEFSGSIPPELGGATECLHLLLEYNQFTGTIPDTLGNMKSLQILSLHYNQLSGPIPQSLNKIVSNGTAYLGLHQMRVNNNMLTGVVPVLDALDSLEFVDFSNNTFDPQPFPSWLNASANTIQTILVEFSNLIGPLPSDILSYPSLQGLYAKNNQLNGTLNIPSTLGRRLRVVSLENNKLDQLTFATNANLPNISLNGNPTCSGTGLVTAGPLLCGTVVPPATLWNSPLVASSTCPVCDDPLLTSNPYTCRCSKPLIVSLEIRAFTAPTINDTDLWEKMRNQTYSSKNITTFFKIDQIWVRDASINNEKKVLVRIYFFPLIGETIDEVTETIIKVAFTQQLVSYTSPFKPEMVKSIINSGAISSHGSHGFPKAAIIGIAVGAGGLLVLIAFLVFVAVKLKRRAEEERKKNPFADWEKAQDGDAPKLKGARWFTFDDIKMMTNNFNEDNVLGEGGYGKVYKAIEAGTGATFAVKRAQEGSKQGALEFKNEIELLSRVHHNNLVGLVGFCYQKGEQMLVYEYMPNGTLTQNLRGSKADWPLDWDRRLLIALGAARGLAYLHDNADPPIIHRDVKSCNILLDKKMNAKVADFGMSLLVPDEKDEKTRKVKGTMGYLDPEYYLTSHLSTKSDVYSFGVVLLELFTGKAPISHGTHIVKTVRNLWDSAGIAGVRRTLDPILDGTSMDELEKFVRIALVCTEDTALERPSMHEVVMQLETLVGPKAHIMPGSDNSIASKASKSDTRIPLPMSNMMSDDFEPASGQFSQAFSHGSSSSHQSAFRYSGGFGPSPVQPK
ncbi:leucine-rich repeat receptor protein kinase HPCA1 isoform X1 [Physcomitrium patens]|uniref:non-specific serine/threonine protein kinase n=2 Tax=Physcomitrium patens TaxID=3218 RepID=A0A2K1IVX9_PHYPA|nr:probable leucine-rich repeat receptor-like protein kinase At5g49770 isoform X1 [Physcomitrium patens]PNR33418.1 hypothetical protein PHYPA_025362 [Physcomitrium patens]|eukprot:XP_024357802.1 probable leucine-rich repeat receptor-like protein kinase At5g49770 isoform X1 [Physcomitrella patens]